MSDWTHHPVFARLTAPNQPFARHALLHGFLRDLHASTGLGVELWSLDGEPLETAAGSSFCDLVHAHEDDPARSCAECLPPPPGAPPTHTATFRRCPSGLWRAIRSLVLSDGTTLIARIGPYQLPRGRRARRQIRALVAGSRDPAELDAAARRLPVRSHAQVAATFTLIDRIASLLPRAQGAPPPEVTEFRADRPFLFAIRDETTDCVLFLGRYNGPKA